MPPRRQRPKQYQPRSRRLVDMQACLPIVVERAAAPCDGAGPRRRAAAARRRRARSPAAGHRRAARPARSDLAAAAPAGRAARRRRRRRAGAGRRRAGSLRPASAGWCLCEQGAGDAQDPRGVGGRGVGAERVREPPVRALDLVGGERLAERPVGVAVAAACPTRSTIDGAGSKRSSAATASSPSQSAHSTKARATASRPPWRRVRGAQPT